MTLARLSLLAISIIIVLLQQRIPSIPSALALRNLSDTWETRNDLPDPSNCDPPQTTQMDSFLFANTSKEQRSAEALKGHLASNFSVGNVSDCANASSTTKNKSPQVHKDDLGSKEGRQLLHPNSPSQENAAQNQAKDMESYIVMHVDEDAPLYQIDSMNVMVKDQDGVLLVNKEQLTGTTPPSASTPLHISDPSSLVKDSLQFMVINDDDVVLVDTTEQSSSTSEPLRVMVVSEDDVLVVNKRQLSGTTSPPSASDIHTAAQSSVAKESMEVNKDDVVLINAEQLRRLTSPPSSPSIHTAAQSSVARESVKVMDISQGDVLWINEEQLAGSAPPSTPTIHTAAQSSVAWEEPVQVMVMDEDDVILVNAEQLGRATPPPIDTSIHTAGQRSAARESEQVMVISEEDVVLVNEEQLAATPPPSDSDIHTASQISVARDEDDVVLVNEERLDATPPPSDTDIHTASQSSVARDSSFHVSSSTK